MNKAENAYIVSNLLYLLSSMMYFRVLTYLYFLIIIYEAKSAVTLFLKVSSKAKNLSPKRVTIKEILPKLYSKNHDRQKAPVIVYRKMAISAGRMLK